MNTNTPPDHTYIDVPEGFLLDPKQKATGPMRRRYMKARWTYTTPGKEPTAAGIKLLKKCLTLPLVKLIRRQKQAARRASTAKYILDSLIGGSRFAPPLQAEQDRQLSILKQVSAEIAHRQRS